MAWVDDKGTREAKSSVLTRSRTEQGKHGQGQVSLGQLSWRDLGTFCVGGRGNPPLHTGLYLSPQHPAGDTRGPDQELSQVRSFEDRWEQALSVFTPHLGVSSLHGTLVSTSRPPMQLHLCLECSRAAASSRKPLWTTHWERSCDFSSSAPHKLPLWMSQVTQIMSLCGLSYPMMSCILPFSPVNLLV